MKTEVTALFTRYEGLVNRSLKGSPDLDALSDLYATDFIAALPQGLMTGRNDSLFRQRMTEGYARYREIGTREMRIRDIRLSGMDPQHCVAHVAWRASYDRKDGSVTDIDFDVHYLVRLEGGTARVFGWVTGDEEAVLREHGLL